MAHFLCCSPIVLGGYRHLGGMYVCYFFTTCIYIYPIKPNSSHLTARLRDVDQQLRLGSGGGAGGGGTRTGIDISQILSKHDSEAAARLPVYADLLHVVTCVCGICSRHSGRTTELWFTSLDHLLRERRTFFSFPLLLVFSSITLPPPFSQT